MTRLQNLNVYLTERLMAAAKEILEVVGDTISEYQKETARTMKENDELRRRLREIGLQANLVLLDSGHPVAPPVSIAGAHQRQLSPEDEWKPNLKKDTEPLPTAINQELSEQHNSRQEPAVRLDQQASVLTSVKSPSDHEFFQPSLPFEVQVVDTVEEGSSPDILPEQIKSEPDGLDYHTQEQPIDSQSLTRVNNDSNTPESKSCAAVNWMESGGVMSEPTTQESSREPSAGTYLTSSGKYKIRCSRSPPPPGLPPRKRSAVPAAVRKDGIDHFPTWQQTRQRSHTMAETQRPDPDFGLRDFPKKRRVVEENSKKMQQDQTESSLTVDDACLTRYIPLYEDRIATRHYCMKKQTRKGDGSTTISLIDKLRKKMRTTRADDEESAGERLSTGKARTHLSRSNARKTSRKIELGWIHEGKQVRKRCGGGTWALDMSKNASKKDILSHAKELFFPNGQSKKGKWEDFTHSVYDFKESELDEDSTVGELYAILKSGILRFYLSTQCRIDTELHAEMDNDTENHADTTVTDEDHRESIYPDDKQPTSAVPPADPSAEQEHTETSTDHLVNVDLVDLNSLSSDSKMFIGGPLGEPSETDLDGEETSIAFSTSTLVSAGSVSSHNVNTE